MNADASRDGETLIRALAAPDLAAVEALAAALASAPDWPRAEYLRIVAGEGARRAALVAERAGRVVGFAVALVVAPESELETVAVEAGGQGRGTGSRLLEDLLAAAGRMGADSMHLEVRASNARARALYLRHGFAETGLRPGYYLNPCEDAVLMWRRL